MAFIAILTAVGAYLVGSVSFAVILSKLYLKKDVRKMGSGNAGATNVLRNAGIVPALLTFLGDGLKGFLACYFGKMIFEYLATKTDAFWAEPIYGAYLCGVLCMLGHIFPIFFKFKGGKGVATSVGIFLVCSPLAIALGLTVFAVATIISKYVSLSSLIATVVVVATSIIFYNADANVLPVVILSCTMGLMVFLKHIENIKRLLNGTENKIGKGGKK